ncbi:MAG: ABC transporter ATP-binding protein [Desulfurococcales archaeon]|nr:ABC transporter ATP-binding protein [Desulfurococcales archaeon]MCE4605691.1 ABC transporter ATP-binding protein [Desulfurococcales archaeon]
MTGCSVEIRSLRVEASGKVLVEVEDLSLGPGGLHFIIGPNGAGKTTLLRSLLGLVRYQGVVKVCGTVPRDARGWISYIPASIMVDPWAKVGEVRRAVLYGSRPGERLNMDQLLGYVGLEWIRSLTGRRFGELSSGEQRLTLIAAAMNRMPKLLVADEPLSFLDMANQIRVIGLLREVSRQVTVVMTTHEIMYMGYADTVTLIHKGSIAYSGPPSRLNTSIIEDVYGIKVMSVEIGGVRFLLPDTAQVVRERFTAPVRGARGSTQRSS